MNVSFLDLKAQHKSIEKDIENAFRRILRSTSFVMGPEAPAFESEFAAYCGAPYCVAVNSGTAAVHLALMAHGIGRGDEVITTPNTYFATVEAISHTGARPVFVDVDPTTYNLNVFNIEKAITGKTRAVLPVHLYGVAVDMNQLYAITRRHKLAVIEDSAQAHGVQYRGRKLSSVPGTSCFSFYPSKVLGACGEGGAVVTHSKKIYKTMQMLKNHGQRKKGVHELIGVNYRMEELQAAILRIKLNKLDDWITRRRRNAALYNSFLGGMEPNVVLPHEPLYTKSNYYVYSITCRKRDALKVYLEKCGIPTQVYYPAPVHVQKAYAFLGYKRGDFPIAEQHAKSTISLPMYPELTEGKIRYIARSIRQFYE